MKRREIAVLAAAAVLVLPIRLLAQSIGTARLGILHTGGRGDPAVGAMVQRLGELSWVEGRNLGIEFRTLDTELKDSEAMAKELARLKCDVILAYGTAAALAVKAHAPATPMVFIIDDDPVGLGLVASLPRPGGMATGYLLLSEQVMLRQFLLLRDLAPAAHRVAVMFEADNPSRMQGLRNLQAAASVAGVALEPMPMRDWKDVEAARKRWKREPVEALMVLNDRVTGANAWNIVPLAHEFRLPAIYGSRYFVNEGAEVSYGVDEFALLMLNADYIARILGGVKPASLPIQQATQFELVVNLVSAGFQGLSIPESVLLQATEVIR
jgi:putative ABC transport system substrate-binding protein